MKFIKFDGEGLDFTLTDQEFQYLLAIGEISEREKVLLKEDARDLWADVKDFYTTLKMLEGDEGIRYEGPQGPVRIQFSVEQVAVFLSIYESFEFHGDDDQSKAGQAIRNSHKALGELIDKVREVYEEEMGEPMVRLTDYY